MAPLGAFHNGVVAQGRINFGQTKKATTPHAQGGRNWTDSRNGPTLQDVPCLWLIVRELILADMVVSLVFPSLVWLTRNSLRKKFKL